jgi:hypothetical protein
MIFNNIFIFFKQIWYYTKKNEIRRDDVCLDYAGFTSGVNIEDKVITYSCHNSKGNQQWQYDKDKKQILHTHSQLCLQMNSNSKVVMSECDIQKTNQQWQFGALI